LRLVITLPPGAVFQRRQRFSLGLRQQSAPLIGRVDAAAAAARAFVVG